MLEFNGSFYPETGDTTHDGIVPKRDLRIDLKVRQTQDRDSSGVFYLGTNKPLPEAVCATILQKLKDALLNAYHERMKDGKHVPCQLRIWPDQKLPSLSELKSLIGK